MKEDVLTDQNQRFACAVCASKDSTKYGGQFRRCVVLAVVVSIASLPNTPAFADGGASSSPWEVNIVPYLWLAGLNGTVSDRVRQSKSFHNDFGDVLRHLNAGVMAVGTVRYNRWVTLIDFDYVNISAKSGGMNALLGQTSVSTTSYLGTIVGGYRIVSQAEGTLDAMIGTRIMSVNTTVNFSGGILTPSISLPNRDTWADPIFALRGIVPLGRHFDLFTYGDYGGGPSNDLTWQVYGGLRYSITQSLSTYAGYRYLSIRHTDKNLDATLDEQGPMFGVGYRF